MRQRARRYSSTIRRNFINSDSALKPLRCALCPRAGPGRAGGSAGPRRLSRAPAKVKCWGGELMLVLTIQPPVAAAGPDGLTFNFQPVFKSCPVTPEGSRPWWPLVSRLTLAGACWPSLGNTKYSWPPRPVPGNPTTRGSEKWAGRACWHRWDGSARCCTWSQHPTCAAPA
jgi:hypothetical protein